jgi:asparagine synthase (glutamine-hydrolysing)
VSFSGGRDSSLVLAVAAAVARREGLDPPIPVTNVFPGRPRSDEESWQRMVLERLGLSEWTRIELRDELDLVGPVAQAVLRRQGVLCPWNAYSQVPALERARGGTLLTGWGGDDVFATWPVGATLQPLRGVRRPVAGDLRRLALWSLPFALRRRVAAARGMRGTLGWLTADARRAALAVWASEYTGEPRRWRARMAWLARRRYITLGRLSMGGLAADAGAAIEHPLFDPGFLAAVARAYGPLGPRSRAAAVRDLAGDLLPPEIIGRTTKGWFGDTVVTDAARAFTREYDGSGLDRSLVDPEALTRTWQDDAGILASGSLVQSLWLASA